MRWFFAIFLSLALMRPALPQPNGQQQTALLSSTDAEQLFRRTVQLMESTTIAVPGLARAGAPVMENARQALINLQNSQRNSGFTWDFLSNVRAYLALTDSVPKPYPFPDEARRQFSELRDSAERLESHFRALLDEKERQLRNPDRDQLRRYAEANEKLGPPSPGAPRVVFLGDSITDGWHLNEYFTGRDFVNRGISGQITGEMLGRMKADVIDLKPRAMLVLAGTNDIARGVPVKTIENNLTMIAELAQFNNIKPMFASILPVSDYHKDANPRFEMTRSRPPATIAEVNGWLQQYCNRNSFVYVDYASAMTDKAGYLQADLADDGLHPNSKGYRVMAPIALAAIDRVAVEQTAGRKRRRPAQPKPEAVQPAAAAAPVTQQPPPEQPAVKPEVAAAPPPPKRVKKPKPEPAVTAKPAKAPKKPGSPPAVPAEQPAAPQPAAATQKPAPPDQTTAATQTTARNTDQKDSQKSTTKVKKKRYLKIFQ